MWWAGMMTTSAGIATMGMGAVGDSSWTSIEDRRRVRQGAVIVAIGAALAYTFAIAHSAGIDLVRLGTLVMVAQLIAALVVTRFADEVGMERRNSELTVRSRAKRHGATTPAVPAVKVALPRDEDVGDEASTGSFSLAQLRAARDRREQEPPPQRPSEYQPPIRR